MIRHLQDGLFRICGDLILNDKDFQDRAKYRNFNAVDENLFYEYRLYRLKKTIEYAYENSRFYKDLFIENKIHPKDINSIEDLRKIPFTKPEDIAGNNYEFLCISQGGVEKPVTFFSSGTTGTKKRLFFSRVDIQNILKFLSVGMNTVTDESGNVQIILPNSNNEGIGTVLCNSLIMSGIKAYITDMMDSSEQQIQYTIKNKPDVWFGDTGTIFRITKEMEGKVDFKSLGVKVLFLTMSPASDRIINYLEKVWGCRISTHYGLTEMAWGMAVDCGTGPVYHYNELNVIAEVVDPITGENLSDGEEGVLVFTSLGREAMPLIRYQSNDFGSISNKKCACGCSLQTMSHVRRRKESILTLSEGAELYPMILDEIIYGFEEVIDYNAYIDNHRDLPVLYIKAETIKKHDGLAEEISRAVGEIDVIKKYMGLPIVELLDSGALKPFCFEKKLIREINNAKDK